jgi:hypothetical protein
MILGYHKSPSGTDSYHFGKVGGADKKFIRVVGGIVLPILRDQAGAIMVIGQLYKQNPPITLIGLGCAVGAFDAVMNAAAQFRKDLKYSHLVADIPPNLETIRRSSALVWGMGEVPCALYDAPPYAVEEIGRQKVNQMGLEKRLQIDEDIRASMREDTDQAGRALNCAVCWALENAAIYQSGKATEPLRMERAFGVTGL